MKHFKNEPRGKHRLHKEPEISEIDAYRWRLDNEVEIVQPAVAVALGATAAHGLFVKALGINANRGRLIARPAAVKALSACTRPICCGFRKSATSGANSIS